MNSAFDKYIDFDYKGVMHHPRSYMSRRAIQFHPFNPLKMLGESSDFVAVGSDRALSENGESADESDRNDFQRF